MEQRDQDQNGREQSEDYGYDLAHEVPAVDQRRRPDPAHRPQHHDAGRRGSADAEPDGDYGYDEAHGL